MFNLIGDNQQQLGGEFDYDMGVGYETQDNEALTGVSQQLAGLNVRAPESPMETAAEAAMKRSQTLPPELLAYKPPGAKNGANGRHKGDRNLKSGAKANRKGAAGTHTPKNSRVSEHALFMCCLTMAIQYVLVVHVE